MITIDGSQGEGGGQILRTCVALSAVTGTEVRIENIRAKRKNPGIRPQHLHAIKAVTRLCNAETKGLTIGSKGLEFSPGKIEGGKFNVNIGTAGSITLVMQALMISAMYAKKDVIVQITGGTDVGWSPPIDYLRFVTLPILERFGYRAEIELIERGYYPVGGGQIKARIEPIREMREIKLLKAGKLVTVRGVSHAHRDLERANVARRQMKAARNILYNKVAGMGLKGDLEIRQEYNAAMCYGSGITLWAETENSILGSDSLGEKGKKAELVGKEAAEDLLKEIESNAALDGHMSDQIIPYLALTGGIVKVSEVTEHARTNVEVAEKFGFKMYIEEDIIRAKKVF